MLCRRCVHHLWSPQLLQFWTSPESVWGASRLGDLICMRCGAVLPAGLAADQLLGTLSRLGHIGFAAASRPLLGPPGEDR
jgi:hypothetical protein